MQSSNNNKPKQVTKEESIYKRFPPKAINNTNIHYLDQHPDSNEVESIHVEPDEVIFQGIVIFICTFLTRYRNE